MIETLSEAIRLGSMLRAQHTDAMFGDGRSCALGAAMEALGLHDGSVEVDEADDIYALMAQLRARFPYLDRRMENKIVALNYRLSREQIADIIAAEESILPHDHDAVENCAPIREPELVEA